MYLSVKDAFIHLDSATGVLLIHKWHRSYVKGIITYMYCLLQGGQEKVTLSVRRGCLLWCYIAVKCAFSVKRGVAYYTVIQLLKVAFFVNCILL